MLQTFGHRPRAPLLVLFLCLNAIAAIVVGNGQQPLCRIVTTIEHDILHRIAQLFRQLVIDSQLAGIDDAHVHALFDGMVEKDGVDGLPHRIVTTEGEGDVGDTAGDHGVRQVLLDPAGCPDEIDGIVVMLLDAGGNGEDIRVEDDILCREVALFGQNSIGALAYLDLALVAVGLTILVKGHDHGSRTVAPDQPGVLDEGRLSLFERDGVDHPLALNAFQAGLDDLPFG